MSATIVNEASAEIAGAGADSTRLARRRAIKKQIAACEIKMQRVRLIEDQIREQDRRLDSVVSAHEEITGPAQNRLAEIEDQIAEALADRKPADAGLEEERVKLLQTINGANETLELETAAINKVRAKLQRESRELAVEASEATVLRNKLAGMELGNPELLNALHCAQQATKWAGARIAAAREQESRWQSEVSRLERVRNSEEDLQMMRARLCRWRSESNAAGDALVAATETAAEIHQRIIDE